MDNIVFLAKNGDKDAFAQLYSLYYTDLYKYALYMTKSPEDASDAVSEAVICAYKNIHKLKDEASFKPWMFKILSRQIFRSFKKSKNAVIWEESVERCGSNEYDIDIRVDLKKALQRLEVTERAIIILSVCHDYSSEEMGRMLNMKSSTVRSKLSRAMKKLKKEIGV